MAPQNRCITSTNPLNEERRQDQIKDQHQRQPEEMLRVVEGTVTQVGILKGNPYVVVQDDDKLFVAGGSWIRVTHSVLDIMGNWGTIRKGFRVQVIQQGKSGCHATARIIGIEDERQGQKSLLPNLMKTGYYIICAPGSGA